MTAPRSLLLAALALASLAGCTTDATHGTVSSPEPTRSDPRHVTFLHIADRKRAASKGAVFVADGGDTFQGSGPAVWSEGQVVLGPLNALGLDVCVPGNWEVVYGPDRFRDLMKRVSCKVTTYNFHDTKTGQRLFAPEVTLERGGVRVAFVGFQPRSDPPRRTLSTANLSSKVA